MIPKFVISHFATRNDLSYFDAESVFGELERYLAVASSSPASPSKIVDEAWHSFILHTREYADYCLRKFGKFIHHVPQRIQTDGSNSCNNGCSSNCERG